MTELRGFWAIDVDDEPDEQAREAAEFLTKMDNEGGMSGLLGYGGPGVFPEEIRYLAQQYQEASDALHVAITTWAANRGVLA